MSNLALFKISVQEERIYKQISYGYERLSVKQKENFNFLANTILDLTKMKIKYLWVYSKKLIFKHRSKNLSIEQQ